EQSAARNRRAPRLLGGTLRGLRRAPTLVRGFRALVSARTRGTRRDPSGQPQATRKESRPVSGIQTRKDDRQERKVSPSVPRHKCEGCNGGSQSIHRGEPCKRPAPPEYLQKSRYAKRRNETRRRQLTSPDLRRTPP